MNHVEIASKYKPTVLITGELAAQIALMHNQCPSGNEWSGLLIYEVTKGSIDKEGLKDLEIRAVGMYPMDFGDSTFTSFEGSPEWFKVFDQFPQIDPMKKEPNWFIGKIHSHHSMGVFHSSTDKGDLYENAPKLPMFLSLITNYKHEWDTKLAIAVEAEQKKTTWWKWKLKGWNLGDEKIEEDTTTPQVTYILDCETLYEGVDWFVDRVNDLSAAKKAERAAKSYNHGPYSYEKGGAFGQFAKANKAKEEEEAVDPTEDMFKRLIRNRMLSTVADLLTLGLPHDFTSAHAALCHVDRILMPNDLAQYTLALKLYFDDWYLENFYNVQAEPEEVVDTILDLVKNNQDRWLSKYLKETFDELRKECGLRTV